MSSGFILGLPGTDQTDIERDLELTYSLPLFAASVSPFISSENTPLVGFGSPQLQKLLECISRMRAQKPKWFIPTVSALNLLESHSGSNSNGQLAGLMAGANVLTVNYTPVSTRAQYQIYREQRFVVELNYAKKLVEQAGMVLSS